MDELTLIRAFLSVVEHGSFSAAAREKNMTVSSVARQVSALEEALGVRLVNRTTRHHSLTEAGAMYYEQVRALVRELDSLRHQAASYQESVKGTLRVQLRDVGCNAPHPSGGAGVSGPASGIAPRHSS